MADATTVHPRPARRIDRPVFDAAPGNLPAALVADLRAARRTHTGINELVGELLDVDAMTVYARSRRAELGRYAWTPAGMEAVVRATGGAHTLAYLARIGAKAPTVRGCHHAALRELAERNRSMAGLIAQAADDLSPDDDTPGRFDAGELARLHAALAEESAHLTGLCLLVEKLMREAV